MDWLKTAYQISFYIGDVDEGAQNELLFTFGVGFKLIATLLLVEYVD
ncbi:hypothetical protein JCM19232_1577 [Vibrio ishigakensis]|uniref:Uncharacterized protein n=1 Tax=Vibrio ishigakensis TaxID=1481914 RepID=A0A0B8PTX2_9VIBR|nr:hypothetical protein JCM19232_1577 [Vibrio ishigakensis]